MSQNLHQFFQITDMISRLEALLPSNVVVSALILTDMNTLCVVRIEKGKQFILKNGASNKNKFLFFSNRLMFRVIAPMLFVIDHR